jgi:glycogen phosphorylase
MNILGQVTVFPTPDLRIARLTELAYNLWWSWHWEAQALYEDIDADLWHKVNHNPVRFLRLVSQQKLDAAAADPGYITRYGAVMTAFDAYMHPNSTWWQRNYPERRELIAYFCFEFGLHEALPIYSGGLGILAGDHCKEASDLGLPFVGVGFLYPQGYFQQRIDGEGRQQSIYEKIDFSDVPAVAATGPDGKEIMVSVEVSGRTIYAKVWRIQVGRVPIFVMDTDVEQNALADRELAARLYGGNQEMRISQEVVLGIGGVRVLRALGLQPTVWHMNEGHAAFLQLERLREFVQEQHLPFEAALWATRAHAMFTTHTPVAAGNDAFAFDLMDRFFNQFWTRIGLNRDQFLGLGRFDYTWGPQFSMTVLALRTAGRANGVSKLHQVVSQHMWQSLWPGVPLPEVPIGYVTNGVHTDSWLHPALSVLFDRHLGAAWREHIAEPAMWAGLRGIPDAELWSAHQQAKLQCLELIRKRVIVHLLRAHRDPADVNAAERLFDGNTLTIGFARRFATYKRASLIFRDQERLKRILNDPERPVQIVFAGKAHPADEPGKALIQYIYQMSRQPGFAGRVVFVEDYDINLARHLVSGVDVWLNTPRRPLEASGTSGQKAGLNGVPNASILDGWWAEGYHGNNGWAIGEGREYADEAVQDEADALSLYHLLEEEIIPLYYRRDSDGMPHDWLEKMRASIAAVGPEFSLARMLHEYVAAYYEPCATLGARLDRDGGAGARALAEWEARVRAGWPQVTLSASGPSRGQVHVGQALCVQAILGSGGVRPEDLAVELVYGHEAGGELTDANVLAMFPDSGRKDGQSRYQVDFASPDSGLFSYGVRVRPQNENLPNPFATYLLRWA